MSIDEALLMTNSFLSESASCGQNEDTWYNTIVIQLTFVIVWNEGEVGYNVKDV